MQRQGLLRWESAHRAALPLGQAYPSPSISPSRKRVGLDGLPASLIGFYIKVTHTIQQQKMSDGNRAPCGVTEEAGVPGRPAGRPAAD